MKDIDIDKKSRRVIRGFSKAVRAELGSALVKLQLGMSLKFPLSRPMPEIWPGAHELRFRDASGIQRVFYFLNSGSSILIFHAFVKKTEKTPAVEIRIDRKRIREMLANEET